MKIFFTLSIILTLTTNFVDAQCNLITNGNFENYTSCPTGLSQITRCVGWFDANVVTGSVTYPSTDYYNCSFNYVGSGPSVTPPPSGSGFVGLNVAATYSTAAEMLGTFANICAGETYTLSFYSRLGFDYSGGNQPLLIQGVNTTSFPVTTNSNYCPLAATTLLSIPKSDVANSSWIQRTYTFTAPANFNALIIGGVCSSSDNYYIYIDNFSLTTNAAAASSITALNTVPCGGGNVGIRFNLPTCRGPFNVTYTVNGTPFTLNGISNNHTINLNITTNSTIILTSVTDASGCTTNPNSTINLVVPPLPSTAPSGISASSNPTCGGSTTLSVVGGSLGSGDTWNWYSGSCGGTLVGTGPSISVSPGTTTSYFVRAEGPCGNTTCATITITVNTNSTAATSINATTNPTCGGSTTLSVVGGSLGTGATWNWFSGSCGGTPVGTGNSITVTPSATTTYFVQAIGTCNTTSCTSLTITVNSSSTAPTSISATTNPTCGGSTTLTVNGGSLGTGATWNWFSGSCGGTPVGTGNSITVTPSTTTTYFVRAQGTCNTTTCASITITVNSNSTAATSINATTNPTCGGSTTLSVVGGSLGTGASWNWFSGSCGGTPVGTGNSITVTPSATTTYFVQAIGTCNTTSCTSITITVNSSSTAPTSATANPSVICVGNSTTLTVNGGSLGTGAQWQWYSGSCGGTAVGTGSTITVTPSTTTTYFVRAVGTCNTTTCASVTVTVDQNPANSNAGPNQSVCGLTATLAGNTPSLGTGTWTQVSGPGTITFSNINSPTSTATASAFGTYVLQWTINNGTCSTSSTVSITFDEMPIPSAAGNDVAICGLTTI